jgi:Cu+-exporting ATPase
MNAEPTTPPATELLISGMTCQNCARHVVEAIQSTSDVRSAIVSLENKSATVRWTVGATANIAAVFAAVEAAGYEAKLAEQKSNRPGTSAPENKPGNWHLNLWLGASVTVTLMVGEWIFGVAMQTWFQWLAFALASVVQIYCGAQFYRGAWRLDLAAARYSADLAATSISWKPPPSSRSSA